MKTLTVPAKSENLDEILDFVNGELENAACSPEAQMQIELAIEEIFVNISSYAYSPGEGETEVRCAVLPDPPRAVIRFTDSGKPFNPLAAEEAGTSEEELLEREGGLGILLVKKIMDDVQYVYEDGKNSLTILKKL